MVMILFALSACEPSESAPFPGGEPADAAQEMVVGAGADEFVLEANRARLGMYPLNASICEPLVRLTRDFRVEPGLATRWEYRGDNTYRFSLRRGVRFHDGQPFDARAVRYSLNRAVATGIGHSFLSAGSVRIVDDTTVDIRPFQPNLRLPEQLVHPSYSMIAPGTDPTVRPVCTGPFRFVSYTRHDRLTVERNDDYWGRKAKLRKLTFRFIPDENTRALALRTGEVDVIFDVNRSMVAALEATPGIEIAEAPPGAVILMYMTTRGRAPYTRMADRTLRHAVARAIDRRTLVKRILEGRATVVNTVNPPVLLGSYAAEVPGVPFDPVESARLLERAGWKVGKDGVRSRGNQRLSLTMLVQPGSVDSDVAQYVQAQLAGVGIEVKIEQLDPGAFASRVGAGQFDLDIEVPSQNDANPAFLLALRWYSRSKVESAAFIAAGPDFDALIEQALNAPEREQVQSSAAAAMRTLVRDEAIAVPLAGIYRIYSMNAQVRGFEPHPSRNNQWWNTVWMAR